MKSTKLNPVAVAPTPLPRNRAEVEMLLSELALAKNNERLTAAAMDAELLAVRDKFQPNLAALADRLTELTQAAQAWAEANPREFGQQRSLEFGAGTLGFRTHPPKLKPLPKWNFDRVLENLRRTEAGRAFIRVKEEVDKEGLLAADLPAESLRPLGLQVIQEESFYITPRLTDTPLRQAA